MKFENLHTKYVHVHVLIFQVNMKNNLVNSEPRTEKFHVLGTLHFKGNQF